MCGGWSKDYNHAERLLWQDPKPILLEVGLKTGQVLLDIGCGDGFFSLPAAKIVGKTGIVYAQDTNPAAIATLTAKAQTAGLSNVRPLLANAEEIIPCPHLAHAALMANVLHDFGRPLEALVSIKRKLRSSGLLANLDWNKEPRQLHGPPLPRRLSQEEATTLLERAGFKIVKNSPSGPYHYLLIATAP